MFSHLIYFTIIAASAFSFVNPVYRQMETAETFSTFEYTMVIDSPVLDAIPASESDTTDLEWAKAEFAKSYFEPTVIEPIAHTIKAQINSNMNEFEFTLRGFYGMTYSNLGGFQIECDMINSIEISAVDGTYYQNIDGFSTLVNNY